MKSWPKNLDFCLPWTRQKTSLFFCWLPKNEQLIKNIRFLLALEPPKNITVLFGLPKNEKLTKNIRFLLPLEPPKNITVFWGLPNNEKTDKKNQITCPLGTPLQIRNASKNFILHHFSPMPLPLGPVKKVLFNIECPIHPRFLVNFWGVWGVFGRCLGVLGEVLKRKNGGKLDEQPLNL